MNTMKQEVGIHMVASKTAVMIDAKLSLRNIESVHVKRQLAPFVAFVKM